MSSLTSHLTCCIYNAIASFHKETAEQNIDDDMHAHAYAHIITHFRYLYAPKNSQPFVEHQVRLHSGVSWEISRPKSL